ncbi:hypothetical protein SASPL_107517 [Salvia splendens]|uniref:Protein kinase domain-containing protein n=1 Tax=Salvia splendens TaxID=180675 RepID=A0A8X8YGK4_SALSN|nr:hypothetical protein SASPL_107517 [Salvia splendens]
MVVIRRKRQRSWINNSENIEELTIHQLNHMPINYSYREIKKMTHNFKAKLGGGPHGTVFRGKLRSSPIAAVKMQTSSSSSSASDKEFMRHASEISRITNANMVKLFGFCIIKGNKRALVHEFVQCGSLDKHISLQTRSELWRDVEDSCGDSPWDPGFQIPDMKDLSHHGLRVRLDSCPQKWCTRTLEERLQAKLMCTVSECWCWKWLRGLWIYNQLCEGKELERGGGEEEEMMKKRTVAALWCIQIKAGDRPTMEQVVNMLQGGVELLHLPPMPFQRPMHSD